MAGGLKQVAFRFQPFSRKQKQILTWWLPESGVSDADGIIADGAIRSGKTVCMSLAFIQWSMHSFNGQNFGMCGKTVGSFRRNVLSVLKQMLPARGYTIRDRRTDNLVVISRGSTENYYYIFGGKDEGSQDLVQGITLAGILLDEIALMPESFVNQATGRCSVDGSKFWCNCNPAGPEHWFKKQWIDERQKRNLLYLHFTMEDNPARAFKDKPDSSMTVGLNLLKAKKGDAFVSAGSTGALLSAATLLIKRIRGIRRAALAPVVPTANGKRAPRSTSCSLPTWGRTMPSVSWAWRTPGWPC